MADQLTALQIKIEADISNAIKQLDTLGVSATNAANSVESAVNRITTAFSSIGSKVNSSFSVTPKLDLSGIANQTLDNLKVGVDVSIADLLATKKYLESQKITLPADADISAVQKDINLVDAEIRRKRTIGIDAAIKPTTTEITDFERNLKAVLKSKQVVNIDTVIKPPNSGEIQRLRAQLKDFEKKREIPLFANDKDLISSIAQIKSRLGELTAGTTAQIPIVSEQSLANAKEARTIVKAIKSDLSSTFNIDIRANGAKEVGRQAQQVGRAFEQVVRDAPSFAISAQQGFIAISNNIGPLQDAFGRLAASAKDNGQSIGQALKGAVSGWNGVGLAISLAVTAVAIFGKEIFSASERAKKLKEYFKDIKDLIESTKTSSLVGVAKAQSQLAETDSWFKIVKDINRSADERDMALKRLQKIDKNAFSNLSIQTSSIDELTSAYDRYKKTLLATSIVQENKSAIDQLSVQKADVETKLIEARRKRDEAFFNLQEKTKAAAQDTSVDTGEAGATLNVDNAKKAFEEADAALESYKKSYGDLQRQINQKQADINFVIPGTLTKEESEDNKKALKDANDRLRDFLNARKSLLEAILKRTDKFSVEYGNLQKQIADIDFLLSNIGVDDPRVLDINKQIFGENGLAIDEGVKQLKSEFSNAIASLKKDIIDSNLLRLEFEFNVKVKYDVGTNFNQTQLLQSAQELYDSQVKAANLQEEIDVRNAESIQNQILKEQTLSKVVTEGVNRRAAALETLRSRQQEINDKVEDYIAKTTEADAKAENAKPMSVEKTTKPLADAQAQSQELINTLSNLISGTIADGIANIAEGFLEGTMSMKKFGQALADVGKQLVVQLIKLAAFQALSAAIGGVPIAGDATKGGLLRKLLGLESGGIVTGPTLAMIGEGKESEAVLPLSYLRNLIGGDAAPGGRLTAELSMDSIIFALDRNRSRQGRSFGG